jgi:hypothetical protein
MIVCCKKKKIYIEFFLNIKKIAQENVLDTRK